MKNNRIPKNTHMQFDASLGLLEKRKRMSVENRIHSE